MTNYLKNITFKKPIPAPRKIGDRYRFEIALDSVRDADIIKRIESHENKSAYIRDLVRKDTQ
jgi:hypothetical protein